MKKINRIAALTLTIILCVANFAFASPSKEQSAPNSTIIKEYTLINQLKAKSDSQLLNQGFKPQEIQSLRNLDYVQHIKDLNKENDEQLKSIGYTSDQIKMIRNYKGTEAETMALSASLTFYANYSNARASSSNSGAEYNIYWSWSSEPFWTLTDYIGVSWSDGFYTDTNTSYMDVTYVNGSSQISRTYTSNISAPGAGCGFSFPLIQADQNLNKCWAKSGSGTVFSYYPGLKHSCEYLIKYGHTIITVAGAGINISGVPSITFKGQCGEEGTSSGHWSM
ncbi:hypothetical protein [Desulfosporosinus sp. FKB]|uniref:hypothetical protein n=1 Tax=Desulfosporosinus sp. FKB TaxID=1969835 RepID=UPI000B49E1BC|nr:hypothetical protein [Desulfosporosinus sp. FKB]